MERLVKSWCLPFEQKCLELIEWVVEHLSLRMYLATSRHPVSVTELYEYIFDNIDPVDSRIILAQWVSMVGNAKYFPFEQKDTLWPITAEIKYVLLFMLCGDHGQPIPLRELYESLHKVNISLSTRQTLIMTIIVRRSHLWSLNQLPRTQDLDGTFAPNQTSSSIEDERCLTKSFHILGTPCLSQCVTNRATTISSLTSVPGMCQRMPSNKSMAQQTIAPGETFPHFHTDLPCFPNLEHPAFESPRVGCEEPGCTRHFQTKKNLKRHMKSHLGKKLYHCGVPECDRVFSRSDTLRVHCKKIHDQQDGRGHHSTEAMHGTPNQAIALSQTGQQRIPYFCSVCNKGFSFWSPLRVHSRSHTGEKPFRCSHAGCGKTFSVSSNAKRHENNMRLPKHRLKAAVVS